MSVEPKGLHFDLVRVVVLAFIISIEPTCEDQEQHPTKGQAGTCSEFSSILHTDITFFRTCSPRLPGHNLNVSARCCVCRSPSSLEAVRCAQQRSRCHHVVHASIPTVINQHVPIACQQLPALTRLVAEEGKNLVIEVCGQPPPAYIAARLHGGFV